MKIFLREAQTGLLRGNNGAWTAEPREAVQFQSTVDAGEEALKCFDREVEIVLHYENPTSEVVLNPIYCIKQRLRPWSGEIHARA